MMRWYDRFWRVLLVCYLPCVLIVPELVMIVMTMTLIPCLVVGVGMEVVLCFARTIKQMNAGAAVVGLVMSGVIFWFYHQTVHADILLAVCGVGIWLVLGWAQVVWWHAQRSAARYSQGKPPLNRWASYMFVFISVCVLEALLIGWLMDTPKQTVVSARGQELTIRYFRPATEPFPDIRFVLPEDLVKQNEAFFESLSKDEEKHGWDVRVVVNGQECRLDQVGRWYYSSEFDLYRWENEQFGCGWYLPAGFTDIKLRIVNLPELLLNQPIEWGIKYPIDFKDMPMSSKVVYILPRLMVVYSPIGLILWLIYFLWFVCRKLNK